MFSFASRLRASTNAASYGDGNSETSAPRFVADSRQMAAVAFVVVSLIAVSATVAYVIGRVTPGATQAATQPITKLPVRGAAVIELPSAMAKMPRPPVSTPVVSIPVTAPAPAPAPAVAPAPTPALEIAAAVPNSKPSPLLAQPAPRPMESISPAQGAFYLQVAAVEKSAEKLMETKIRDLGHRVTITPGPTDGTIRILTGPYQERTAWEAAQRNLETAGYKPFLKRQ